MLQIRIEDNGPFAFRWRGMAGEHAALAHLGPGGAVRAGVRAEEGPGILP